ncbi:MAG TPA: sigma-70 family RNA polymerase sigma factor [Blastocatellia bacterium]|nr:sigma-70 family RNA polymerase sigma factor [Blastocatellia bacterium]
MGESSPEPITDLLVKWRSGDSSALERLIPLVYNELQRLAHRCLRNENAGYALQTSELINEAYVRLVKDCGHVQWRNRTHFFAMAATVMRRVLVDEARKRLAAIRGGGLTQISLDESMTVSPGIDSAMLIELDRAIERLAAHFPRKSRVVEMRFFGGMSIEETAEAMGVSIDTVKREWRTARLWLLNELSAPEASDGRAETLGTD